MKRIFSPPFIIVGSPRSGTELLRAALDSHSQIACAREIDWFTERYTSLLKHDLSEEAMLACDPGEIPSGLNVEASREPDNGGLRSLFHEYLIRRNKRHLAITLRADTTRLEAALELFPDSKYIHIVRDGRDVACSILDHSNGQTRESVTDFDKATLFSALRLWHANEQKTCLLLSDRSVKRISYEQLVSNPVDTLRQVLIFLDLPVEELLPRDPNEQEREKSETGPNDSSPSAYPQECGRWATRILPENWDLIDTLYGTFLEQLGYRRCHDANNESDRFLHETSAINYQSLSVLCENEILSLRKTIQENTLKFSQQLRSNKEEISHKRALIEILQKEMVNRDGQIAELNRKINGVIPSLHAQLGEKSQTIHALQAALQNHNELLTRIISGKSFKLGRILTSPTRYLRSESSDEQTLRQLTLRKKRYVNLGDQLKVTYGNHRSGWAYTLACLAPINRSDSIYLDAFIERTFVWKPGDITPTLKPWIGFIHVPPNVPDWFQSEQSNDAIFQTKAWQESLPYCKGLYTLSEYHKRSLEKKLNIPINALLHPTEFPGNTWQFEKFVLNGERKIVQIGWWLRKLHAIFELPASDYKKVFLRVSNDAYFYKIFHQEYLHRKRSGQFHSSMYDTVTIIDYLKNAEYDRLLSENIVFVDLYDSSANNLIIECIARNTPLLINPLEPVVEYLGKDYPFYFISYEEAIDKAQNLDLIEKTHNYLKNNEIRQKLTGEYFLQSFTNSEILNTCQ